MATDLKRDSKGGLDKFIDKPINGYESLRLCAIFSIADTMPLSTSCWEICGARVVLTPCCRLLLGIWLATVRLRY